MGALFVSASSQFLENNAPPLITVPLTVGMWFNPSAVSATTYLYQLAAGGSATANGEGWDIRFTSTGIIGVGTAGGGTRTSANTIGTIAANTWTFVIGRWIAANLRRIDILFPGGATEHVSTVVSNTPPGPITRESIGCSDNSVRGGFYSGIIGEFWKTNTDIQPDGLALTDATLRQLAYYGPFSIQSIAKDIVDYRSLRSSVGSDTDEQPDYAMGNKGRQTWVNNAGVIYAAHPPLSPGYRGPSDIIRVGIV